MLKQNFNNFISGSLGSMATFTQIAPEVAPTVKTESTDMVVASLVTLVGGLLTSILTNIFKKWFVKEK